MSAATRLTFLYPHLLRATTRTQPQQWVTGARTRTVWATGKNSRRLAHSLRRAKSSFAPRRHGKAVAPASWEEQQQQKPEGATAAAAAAEEESDTPAFVAEQKPSRHATTTAGGDGEQLAAEDEAGGVTPDVIFAAAPQNPPAINTTTTATEATGSASESKEQQQEQKQQQPWAAAPTTESSQQAAPTTEEAKAAAQAKEAAKSSGPLEAVLHMQPPEKLALQHPSMSPPPYEHHFDSYSLVKRLEEGGYTPAQAVTAMKGIRKLLAKNLSVAQQSLVSKSDVENEAYLFSAACSELNTEVKNNRRIAEEELRQQRTHLQHEVDILTQSLNQEIATLNDNVKGMYNDRKQAVREEQKAMDSAIQKISYKISIDLTSDAKTEIEGVRWVLIWRSVLGIIFMAFLTLGTLRLATYQKQRRQEEERVRKAAEEKRRQEEARLRREEEKKRRREDERRRKEEEDARKEEEKKRIESEAMQRLEEEEEVRRFGPRNNGGGGNGGEAGGTAVDDVESLSAN